MLTESEIRTLVERIVARTDPQKVIVFGSHAKGTAGARSDLDLLVIQRTSRPVAHRLDDIRPLLGTLVVRVDVHVYTPEEIEDHLMDGLSFISSVLKTGLTVYEKAGKTQRTLAP